jgi:hypothetical protein
MHVSSRQSRSAVLQEDNENVDVNITVQATQSANGLMSQLQADQAANSTQPVTVTGQSSFTVQVRIYLFKHGFGSLISGLYSLQDAFHYVFKAIATSSTFSERSL